MRAVDRDRRRGWRCASTPRSSRRTAARRHPPSRARAASGPTCAASTPTSTAASSCCSSYDDRAAPIGEVLLDQRVFCGVGNVYRCEVLWACELSPFARVGELAERCAVRLVNVAARLLRANLHTAERVAAARRARRARRLRAQRSALLPLQRDGARPARRRATPASSTGAPAARSGSPRQRAAATDTADRPAPRRQAVRRRAHLADRVARNRMGQLDARPGRCTGWQPIGRSVTRVAIASRTFIRLALCDG